MVMEKGKLLVSKTKKGGFAGQIVFDKEGKSKTLGVPPGCQLNDKLNGQNCTFVRKDGLIVKIVGSDLREENLCHYHQTAVLSQQD